MRCVTVRRDLRDTTLARREQLREMHRRKAELDAKAKGASHEERLELARRWAAKIRADAPGVHFVAQRMLHKIAEKSGIPFPTLKDWHRKGDLPLQIEPDD